MSKFASAAFFLLVQSISLLVGADKPDSTASLRELRFSLDGKYVLAQDDEQITVLTADPFAVRFRIPARDATLAQFTPDSSSIIFVRSATLAGADKITVAHGTAHFERWGLADGKLITSTALPDIVCGSLVLAPDGRTYACDDYQGTLHVIDVTSSQTILEKEKFVQPIFSWIGTETRIDTPTDLGSAGLHFSPDGTVLIASGAQNRQFSNDNSLFWDVGEHQSIKVKGLLNLLKSGVRFAFLDSGRILIAGGWTWQKENTVRARIVTFPDGKRIATVTIPIFAGARRAADPAFVIGGTLGTEYVPGHYGSIRDLAPSGVTVAVELATGQAIISKSAALDVFGDHYVTEVRPGEIGLYERHKGLQATAVLH